MPWFRVDDRLPDHRKARKAGTAAMGLWLLAGAWSAGNLTDGWVPRDVVKRYGTLKQAERLEAAGLWVPGDVDGIDGWWFHQWSEHQPTRAQVEQKRKAATERQQRWRETAAKKLVRDPNAIPGVSRTNFAQGQNNETTPVFDETPGRERASRIYNGVSHGVSHAAPDPTRTYEEDTPSGVSLPRTPARTTARDIAKTAHSPEAHRLVEQYAQTCNRRPPTVVLTALALEVDALLAEQWTPDELAPVLAAWGAKGLHTKTLPSVAHEVTNRAPNGHIAPQVSPTDVNIAAFLSRGNTQTPSLRALPGGNA